jgi:hypothetical protein
MPRVHINVQDINEIEELEDQEDWVEQLGLANSDSRRVSPNDPSARGNGQRREVRFGGAESLERRRNDRRKRIHRGKPKG